jgi:uncharacterized protein (DUF4415 family)
MKKDINDNEIDFSDAPEITQEQAKNAVVMPAVVNFSINKIPERPKKVLKSLRIDDDVLKWFQSNHNHYQTQINAILRAYYQNHK